MIADKDRGKVQPLCHLCDRWACVLVDGVVKLCLPCWREVHLSCYPAAWQPQHREAEATQ